MDWHPLTFQLECHGEQCLLSEPLDPRRTIQIKSYNDATTRMNSYYTTVFSLQYCYGVLEQCTSLLQPLVFDLTVRTRCYGTVYS